jgi:uncharacterized protein
LKQGSNKKLGKKELAFLSRSYIARVATAGKALHPHVSPVYFANSSDSIFFATEKDTRKFKDLMENAFASVVVDDYDADWMHGRSGIETVTHAVVVSGKAKIFFRGNTYHKMYQRLFEKYPDYRAEAWKEGASPIVRLSAHRALSWGL